MDIRGIMRENIRRIDEIKREGKKGEKETGTYPREKICREFQTRSQADLASSPKTKLRNSSEQLSYPVRLWV